MEETQKQEEQNEPVNEPVVGQKPSSKKKVHVISKDWVPLEGDVLICAGSISQAHKKLKKRNEQGAAICVVACAFSQLKTMKSWSQKTLDEIIELGSNLHTRSRQVPESRCILFLQPPHVYRYFFVGKIKITMKVDPKVKKEKLVDEKTGTVEKSRLEKSLQKFFEDFSTGIVAMQSFIPIFFGVWKSEKFFYMFDPQEHDSKGNKWEGYPTLGVCYVKRFTQIKPLANTIYNNVNLESVKSFKIYPCNVEKVVRVNTTPPESLESKGPQASLPTSRRNSLVILNKVKTATSISGKTSSHLDILMAKGDKSDRGAGGDIISATVKPKMEVPPEKKKLSSVTKFKEIEEGKYGILSSITHQNDPNFSKYAGAQGFANAIAALTMLRLLKSRHWVKSTVYDILKTGEVIHSECLKLEPGQELKTVTVKDQCFHPIVKKGAGAIGCLVSTEDKILSLEQALKNYFLDYDCGILLGPYVVAVWKEDDRFYMFDPNERNMVGRPVAAEEKGFACVTWYTDVKDLVATYLSNVPKERYRENFVLCKVVIKDFVPKADDWFNFQALTLSKWIIRGTFSQKDRRFSPESRNCQSTATAIVSLAYKELMEEKDWTSNTVDQVLLKGDDFYLECVEALRTKNLFKDPHLLVDEVKRILEMESKRFNIEIDDCLVNGVLNAKPDSAILNLKKGFEEFFRESESGIVSANDQSMAVWRREDAFYYYDPHSRNNKGISCVNGTACLLRTLTLDDLTTLLLTNFGANAKNWFNISRVVLKLIEITEEGFLKPPLNNFEEIDDCRAILRSEISQNHQKYGLNAGKQTVPMCLTALALNTLLPSCNWSKEDMGQVLDFGNRFYFKSMEANYSRELPEELDVDEITTGNVSNVMVLGQNLFEVEFEEVSQGNFENLQEALESLQGRVEQEGNEVFQTIFESPDLSVALWRDDNLFYLFDPQPRDDKGQVYGKDNWSVEEVKEKELQFQEEEESEEEEEEEHDDDDDYEDVDEKFIKKNNYESQDNIASKTDVYFRDGERIEEEEEHTEEAVIEEEEEAFGEEEADEADLMQNEEEARIKEEELRKQIETEGKSCLLRFSRLEDVVSHILDNVPPNKRRESEYTLKKVILANTPLLHAVKDPEAELVDDEYAGDWYNFKEIDQGKWILEGRKNLRDNIFPEVNRGKQQFPMCFVALIFSHLYPLRTFKRATVDDILIYGDRFHTQVRNSKKKLLKEDKSLNLNEEQIDEYLQNFVFTVAHYGIYDFVTVHKKRIQFDLEEESVKGDITSTNPEEVRNLQSALEHIFTNGIYGIAECRNYMVALWKENDAFYMFNPNPTGPSGFRSPVGVATIVRSLQAEELARIFLSNLTKIGSNFFVVHSVVVGKIEPVKVELPKEEKKPKPLEGYVLVIDGKYIIRGSRQAQIDDFKHGVHVQSSSVAFVALAFSVIKNTKIWTKIFVDEIMIDGGELYQDTLKSLGDKFNPFEDFLTVHQVKSVFRIGSNKVSTAVRYGEYKGLVDTKKKPKEMNLRQGLECFFGENTHGILLVHRLVLAVWQVEDGWWYLFDPNSRGSTGLPAHGGMPCVMRFRNAKITSDHVIACLLDVDKTKLPFLIVPVEVVVEAVSTKKKRKKISSVKPRQIPVTCPDKLSLWREKNTYKKIVEKKLFAKQKKEEWMQKRKGFFKLHEDEYILRGKTYVDDDRQVPVAYVAFVFMAVTPDLDRWTWESIELVLECGNQLYIDSFMAYKPVTSILTLHNTLKRFRLLDFEIKLKVFNPVVIEEPFIYENIYVVLESVFLKMNFCILNYRKFLLPIYFKSGYYYMFDPNPRDGFGYECFGVNGASAMLMKYGKLSYLIDNILFNLTDYANIIAPGNFALIFLKLENVTKVMT